MKNNFIPSDKKLTSLYFSLALLFAFEFNMQSVFPSKKPIELLGLILSSQDKVIETADAKSYQDAPVYLAWFESTFI